MSDLFSMNSYVGMRILSMVREGDYAHAGEEAAIDLAMSGVGKNPDRLILDAGCGRGGTADYLVRHGWGQVMGIDIEPESIKTARRNYPRPQFLIGDVCDVGRHIDQCPDLICMFNAYYCFQDQPKALRALAEISRAGASMIIFDHVDRGSYQAEPLMDAGEPFLRNPPRLSDIPDSLASAGWRPDEIEEVNDSYIGWYRRLVDKIDRAHDVIAEIGGEAGYDHVRSLYQGLVDAAQEGRLGAAIIRATRR
jgi:SAM-dependent methyltransferase